MPTRRSTHRNPRTQVSTGPGTGYDGRGIYGQMLHIDRARRLVIVINSATEHPAGTRQATHDKTSSPQSGSELDAEKK
jgi:CubicO group peptidase (beta-lactamase class C family)